MHTRKPSLAPSQHATGCTQGAPKCNLGLVHYRGQCVESNLALRQHATDRPCPLYACRIHMSPCARAHSTTRTPTCAYTLTLKRYTTSTNRAYTGNLPPPLRRVSDGLTGVSDGQSLSVMGGGGEGEIIRYINEQRMRIVRSTASDKQTL